jgi:hypothetical protein
MSKIDQFKHLTEEAAAAELVRLGEGATADQVTGKVPAQTDFQTYLIAQDWVRQAVDRRVAKGNRRDESEAMLTDLLRLHTGDILQGWLVFQAFGTEREIKRFIERLDDAKAQFNQPRELPEKRIVATLKPESVRYVQDGQRGMKEITVEVPGEQSVDLTEKVLSLSLKELRSLESGECDDYELGDVPAYGKLVDLRALGIQAHGFWLDSLTDQICSYFSVDDIHEITDGQLVAARDARVAGAGAPVPRDVARWG